MRCSDHVAKRPVAGGNHVGWCCPCPGGCWNDESEVSKSARKRHAAVKELATSSACNASKDAADFDPRWASKIDLLVLPVIRTRDLERFDAQFSGRVRSRQCNFPASSPAFEGTEL